MVYTWESGGLLGLGVDFASAIRSFGIIIRHWATGLADGSTDFARQWACFDVAQDLANYLERVTTAQ